MSGGIACGIPSPNTSFCAWSIGGGAIAPGRYAVGARVVSSHKGELVAVLITVEEGALPIVSISALAVRKQNPSSRLVFIGAGTLPEGGGEGDALELAWSLSPPDIDLSLENVTSTGSRGLRLVVLKNLLRPGGQYTFELRASYRGKAATATSTVLMNRPPFGGSFELSHATPIIAFDTVIELRAAQWVDDDADDLPLR